MRGDQLDALVDTLDDALRFDGLRVSHGDEGYRIETDNDSPRRVPRSELRDALTDVPRYVSNWWYWHRYLDGRGYTFLRWLEGAADHGVLDRYERLRSGIERTWGEVLVTTTLGADGVRRYALRHVADRHVDDLERHVEPGDAREIATFDENGRYRPLRAAPTLARGWCFLELEPDACLDAIDYFYPATVANWTRERTGELDVTHWHETADRQTGIYDVVEELPPDAVERAARACCVDAMCGKRREWDFNDDRELDVPRGDGHMPCREPCSFLIAAAKEWSEGDASTSETIDLSPAERADLAGLLQAVADGASVDPGDVGNPAHPVRARYLLASILPDELD